MKWFEDIFTKSKLMIVSGIVAIAAFLALFVFGIIGYSFSYAAICLVLGGLMLIFLVSCKQEETSLQKAVSSAILAIMLCFSILIDLGMFGAFSDFSSLSSALLSFVYYMTAFLSIVIFMNHLFLQCEHTGGKGFIIVSRIFLLLFILSQVATFVVQSFVGALLTDYIHNLAFLATAVTIVCMESRIQKYKARRAKALAEGRWTPEEREKSKKIFKF